MPFKDPDPTDPNMLVGVMLPADAEATRDMAYVFAEEFARFGYTREQLLWLFKNPFYGGAHGAYLSLGERETLSIIDECLNVWGIIKVRVQDVQDAQNVQPPPVSSSASAGEGEDPEFEPAKRLERSAATKRLERFNRRREEREEDA